MSGGKGGSSTSSVQIPEYIEKAAQQNLNKAEKISQIGFVPQYGPSVAAFTPTQNAAFDNIASSASAFGMASPGVGTSANYGGMGQPTDFGGGVMGYSAKPLYDNMVSEFAADRPAQYDYINSFFIDPYTGQTGSNVTNTNYNQYSTATDMANAQMANDLAIAQANAAGSALSAPEFNTYVNTIQEATGNSTYNPYTDTLTQSEIDAINANPEAQLAQDAIYMNILGTGNNTLSDGITTLMGGEPTFDNPSSSGSYGGSLVTGQLSTDLTGIPGLAGEIVDSIYQGVDFDGAVAAQGENFAEQMGSTQNADGTYDISSWFNPTGGTSTSQASNDGGSSGGSSGATTVTISSGDTLSEIAAANNTTVQALQAANNISNPNLIYAGDSLVIPGSNTSNNDSGGDDNDGGGGGGGGCVVATHAVNSGAFTNSMKREAVVWCMHNLHDKWWGEAIRRGYRHLGRKKIEQGKAHEHYQEFRNYIDFASGKKRTLKGAVHFAARSAQFFVVGLIKGDA